MYGVSDINDVVCLPAPLAAKANAAKNAYLQNIHSSSLSYVYQQLFGDRDGFIADLTREYEQYRDLVQIYNPALTNNQYNQCMNEWATEINPEPAECQ